MVHKQATSVVRTMSEDIDKETQRNFCRKLVDSLPCEQTSTFPLFILVPGFLGLKKCSMTK